MNKKRIRSTIALTEDDLDTIRIIQNYFANLEPVSIQLCNTDVVRLSLKRAQAAIEKSERATQETST